MSIRRFRPPSIFSDVPSVLTTMATMVLVGLLVLVPGEEEVLLEEVAGDRRGRGGERRGTGGGKRDEKRGGEPFHGGSPMVPTP